MTASNLLLSTNLYSLGYGDRVDLFRKENISSVQVNPRQEVGKIGIRSYSSSLYRLFHRCLSLTTQDAKTGEKKELLLNRSSTIKWMNAQVKKEDQVSESSSDEEILSKLQNITKIAIKPTPKEHLNHSSLNSFFTPIQAAFTRAISYLCSSSIAMQFLRLKLFSEKQLQNASEVLACSSYNQAVREVKAYEHFVGAKPTHFDHIPATSKDSYIKRYTQDPAFGELSLYRQGTIPPGSKKDTSTGTSGKPTSWYRGPEEIQAIHRSIHMSAKVAIGDKPYYLINGFALGPWATGITLANAAGTDPHATVCNIGLDTKEIFQAIKDAVSVVPKGQPIVVIGYPPHLKEVVDLAIREGFPLDKYNIVGIVGGESMSENQRSMITCQRNAQNEITRTGFTQCYSAYGASDLDVTIGYESEFAIELRKTLHANPELAKELVGENEFIPMIFPYNPLEYHIEHDENYNLLFTCLNEDRISPRIRYNLGDRGKTMPMSDVLAILQKHGVTLQHPPALSLPLLFVWGRVGTHVSFEGLKIAPENLEDGLRAKNLLSSVANYGFLQLERNGTSTAEILIELNDGIRLTDQESFHKQIVEGLRLYNQEFNKLMQTGRSPPALKVYTKGNGPMALQRERYPHRKKQYIFREGDEFVPHQS